MTDLEHATEQARAGGPERHRAKAAEQGKLPVRERVAMLLDPDSFVEDGLLAGWEQAMDQADSLAWLRARLSAEGVRVSS